MRNVCYNNLLLCRLDVRLFSIISVKSVQSYVIKSRTMGKINNSFLWGIIFASATWSISLYLYWLLNMSGKFDNAVLFVYNVKVPTLTASPFPYLNKCLKSKALFMVLNNKDP